MKLARTFILLLLTAWASVGFAQATGGDNLEQKRRLIEQKIRLIDMLVNSPAAKSSTASRDPESAALLEKGRQSFEAAKQAFTEARLDDATRLLDETLKSVSSASRKISADGSGLSDSAQRKSLADMTEQVATYRASLVDLTRDGQSANEAQRLLVQVDALSAESRQLADSGRLGDANKKLASAYKLMVEEISKLRAGQVVVMSLKFETPAEEFAYEQKRFGSNLIMIDMMIAEGRAEGQKRKLVDSFLAEGRKLKEQAEVEAGARRHQEAVTLMEKATGQLNRALQSMGVPVF